MTRAELRFKRIRAGRIAYELSRNGRQIAVAGKTDAGRWNAISTNPDYPIEIYDCATRSDAVDQFLEQLDAIPPGGPA